LGVVGRMRYFWIVWFAAFVHASFANAQDIEAFEQELDETIKVACHGYLPELLPDAVSSLRELIYENSALCEQARNADDQQFKAYVREIGRGALEPDLGGGDDTGIQRALECKNEYMCMAVRDRLYREDNPVSQAEYDRVANYCEGRYACIEAFFLDWPQPLPVVAVNQGSKGGSLHQSLASLRAKPANESPAKAPAPTNGLSLSSVFSERKRMTFNEGINTLKTHNLRLGDRCQCSRTSGDCYSNPYGPIKDRIAGLESQRQGQCNLWNQQFAGQTPPNQTELDVLLSDVEGVVARLDELDLQAQTLIAQAARSYRKQVAVAKRKQDEAESFQWGKLTALGVGALAGGITELETADQIEFVGAIVNDSMGGVEGIGSTQAKGGGSVTSGSSLASANGSHSLTCHMTSQSICVEYTLSSQQAHDQFLAQCRSAGARILNHCEVTGLTCTMRTGGRTAVTVTPNHDPDSARASCEAGGGTYSLR